MDIKELVPQKLKEKFSDIEFEVSDYKDDLTIKFDKKEIVDVCKFLKEDPELQFIYCSDVTAVDWAKRKNRFMVVYNIFSLKHSFRLRLKADVDEKDCSIESVSSIWGSANWHERETYDMYGIKFNDHPDLRRIYMPEEFEYHPLRKDFPLMGIPGSIPLPKK
ncbi:MAG: NADH-quinone oxidoreductase subunit C [Ignavibacteria bacterium]|nr:NADH-quinone oxidoreductase subunit C [Ignavibacteria bacterium]MBT8382235.1 NADH-quinone oxidoreductase subunit C [Ignavibacteria bacterium]MBT8390161.1 NADH-quinone oxidoreductase subunit C [Ignavibacteria bacterium]NNJ52758.1 NADH-quinone oxidoreductase subunit C [Ignavibacteriaceae bacterium]NNL20340.1 NADH-quinone oxidoreductase subunit C [Ignavibacteriaceae bacterium]